MTTELDTLSGKTILVVSPHPDDETYGCGGLMARAVKAGARVCVLVISAPESLVQVSETNAAVGGDVRIAEFERAMDRLDVTERCILHTSNDVHMRLDQTPQLELVGWIERSAPLSIDQVRPDILCLPAASYNQDHAAVFRAGIAACRPHLRDHKAFCPTVLVYEQPQLHWGSTAFRPSVYVDISDVLPEKIEALAVYASQVRRDPHHGSLENVERLARFRGSEISVSAAEAFECLRMVI